MTGREEALVIVPSADAELDEAELSDEDLEHVVGGLARAWLPPGERSSSQGDGGVAAQLPLKV